MTTASPARLREVANIIRTSGWTQGVLENNDGAHCILGAFRECCGFNQMYAGIAETRLLAEMIGKHPDTPVTGIIASWNDRPGRTVEDVLTLLEQAVEKVEAEL